jgi:hypothetical protein
VAHQKAADGWRRHALHFQVMKFRGQRPAQTFGVLGVLQHQGALYIRAAVPSAGKFKMPLAHRARFLENSLDFFTPHESLQAAGVLADIVRR